MKTRPSVRILVAATVALIVAVATFAIARSRARKDDLPSPFVAEPESAAMRAVAQDSQRQATHIVDTRGETAAQSAERLAEEDRLIDRVAGTLNNDNTGTATGASPQRSTGIPLPASGVAVAGATGRDDVGRSAPQASEAAEWQTPYAEDYDAGWGIGGFAGYGVPLNISDFTVNSQGVANSVQTAQRGQQGQAAATAQQNQQVSSPQNPQVPPQNPQNPQVPAQNPQNPQVPAQNPQNPQVPAQNPQNPQVPVQSPQVPVQSPQVPVQSPQAPAQSPQSPQPPAQSPQSPQFPAQSPQSPQAPVQAAPPVTPVR